MRKKRILVLAIDPAATSSWYRIIRPLEILTRQMHIEVQVIGGPTQNRVDWTSFSGVDLVFAMRPGGKQHDMILQRAKDRGIPIISDYDDALLDVPYHHRDFDTYIQEDMRKSIKKCLRLSDQIWVTNERLGANLKRHAGLEKDPVVIPNAIDDFMFGTPTKPTENQGQFAIWRGGSSHDNDLLRFGHFMGMWNKRMPLVFFGTRPWMILEYLDKNRMTVVPGIFDPEDFFRKLGNFGASYHLVPLVDDEFNRCKSNIAYLEGAWFGGSVCYGPEWWGGPGLFSILNNLAPVEGMERVNMVKAAQAFIAEDFVLSKTNAKRATIFAEVLGL